MLRNKQPFVHILVLATNEKKYLEELIPSILDQTYPKTKIFVMDNNSIDGTSQYIKKKFPRVSLIKNKSTLSYPKAYNMGLKKLFEDGASFCLILNADIKGSVNLVSQLVKTYLSKSLYNKVGLIQPVILLYDKPDKINTIGNALHFLGFGYCKNFLDTYHPLKNDRNILSVSGAAMLISKDYFKKLGGFDEEFVMYNEDQNLSWRGLLLGYNHYLCSSSIILHKYDFYRRPIKMYHSEKNRLMMVLENYETRTLILLTPLILLNEIFITFHAIFYGWFLMKIRADMYILTNIRNILTKRHQIQNERSIPDKRVISNFDSKINSPIFRNILVSYFINPIYSFYFKAMLFFLR